MYMYKFLIMVVSCILVSSSSAIEVTEDMCVNHFLIQPDPEGVKLQGWSETAFSKKGTNELYEYKLPLHTCTCTCMRTCIHLIPQ